MLYLLQPVVGEKQADQVLDHGLNDPFTRSWLVLAFIIVVGAIVWALVILPAQLKARAAEREDKKAERADQAAQLEQKRKIEEARAQSAASLNATAQCLENTIPHARAILELGQNNLNRNCQGGPLPGPRSPA